MQIESSESESYEVHFGGCQNWPKFGLKGWWFQAKTSNVDTYLEEHDHDDDHDHHDDDDDDDDDDDVSQLIHLIYMCIYIYIHILYAWRSTTWGPQFFLF